MSKIATYSIPCPVCKKTADYQIFHSINTNYDNAVNKVINDEINFVCCKHCNNQFQVKAGLLFNNMQKMYAVYYNPTSFDSIEQECLGLKKMFGDNFYLANPLKFKDWEAFKSEIRRKEGLIKPINLGGEKYIFKGNKHTFDSYWNCDICDGNSDTGCLYFDPTECPRHT